MGYGPVKFAALNELASNSGSHEIIRFHVGLDLPWTRACPEEFESMRPGPVPYHLPAVSNGYVSLSMTSTAMILLCACPTLSATAVRGNHHNCFVQIGHIKILKRLVWVYAFIDLGINGFSVDDSQNEDSIFLYFKNDSIISNP